MDGRETWHRLIIDLISVSLIMDEVGIPLYVFSVSFPMNCCSCSFPIFLLVFFLLICSISLQMERISLLSYFLQNMCSLWAIFRQPTVSLPPTRSLQAARVAFLKCQSDHVTLLPQDRRQLPTMASSAHVSLGFGGLQFGAQLSPALTHTANHMQCEGCARLGGKDTQRTGRAP